MSRTHAEEIARIIGITDERQEFATDEADGYVYFAPTGSPHGTLSAWMLRALADELDRRNAPHEADINQYFKDHPEPEDETTGGLSMTVEAVASINPKRP